MKQQFWGRNWNGKITIIGSKDKIPNSKQSTGNLFFGWNSTLECSEASDNVWSYKVKDSVGIWIRDISPKISRWHHLHWRSHIEPQAHGDIRLRDWCWCPPASRTCSRPWWLWPTSSCLPWNPSYNNLLKARSMADQGNNSFPCIQTLQILYLLDVCWCLKCCYWIEWFPLQLCSDCRVVATLMICVLMLLSGPWCSSPTALGSTAAATTTWPRSWQDSTCLCLPMTMVSSLNLYLINSSSGLCWSKCHYSYSAVREVPIKYLQPDINEKRITCCFVEICILNL